VGKLLLGRYVIGNLLDVGGQGHIFSIADIQALDKSAPRLCIKISKNYVDLGREIKKIMMIQCTYNKRQLKESTDGR
jgi:hypothetical protein